MVSFLLSQCHQTDLKDTVSNSAHPIKSFQCDVAKYQSQILRGEKSTGIKLISKLHKYRINCVQTFNGIAHT